MMLNMSHFLCDSCSHPHEIFGDVSNYDRALRELGMNDLGRLPLSKEVSSGGDRGQPLMSMDGSGKGVQGHALSNGASEAQNIFNRAAQTLFSKLPI